MLPKVELISVLEAAGQLRVSPASADNLLRCGLLGTVYSDGRRQYVTAWALRDLAERPPAPDRLPPAVWARPGPPVDEGDGRRFRGWHAAATAADRKAGVDRWWQLRQPDRLLGALFVVTVAGFVAETYRIRRLTGQDEMGRWQLALAAARDKDASCYLGTRLPARQGGRLIRHQLPLS